jgi:hypothetical protein
LGLLLAGPFADAYGVNIWWVLTGIASGGTGFGVLLVPSIVNIEYRVSSEGKF